MVNQKKIVNSNHFYVEQGISFVTQKIEEVTKKLWFQMLGKVKAAELFFVFLF